jgi:hypothetical protein
MAASDLKKAAQSFSSFSIALDCPETILEPEEPRPSFFNT